MIHFVLQDYGLRIFSAFGLYNTVPPVLGYSNVLLRFRFRLWKTFVLVLVLAMVPVPGPALIPVPVPDRDNF
jgi:hypothetical protein